MELSYAKDDECKENFRFIKNIYILLCPPKLGIGNKLWLVDTCNHMYSRPYCCLHVSSIKAFLLNPNMSVGDPSSTLGTKDEQTKRAKEWVLEIHYAVNSKTNMISERPFNSLFTWWWSIGKDLLQN